MPSLRKLIASVGGVVLAVIFWRSSRVPKVQAAEPRPEISRSRLKRWSPRLKLVSIISIISIVSFVITSYDQWSSRPAQRAEDAYATGRQLEAAGRATEALVSFEEALTLQPGSAKAYRELGYHFVRTRQWSAGVEALCQSLAYDATDVNALVNLGITLSALNSLDNALVHLRRAVELAPESGFVWRNLAAVLSRTADPALIAEGVEAGRRAIDLEPHPIAWNNYTLALLDSRDYSAAKDAAGDGLQDYPEHSTLRMVLVLATGHVDGWEEARSLADGFGWDTFSFAAALVHDKTFDVAAAIAEEELAGYDRAWILVRQAASERSEEGFNAAVAGFDFEYSNVVQELSNNRRGNAIGGYLADENNATPPPTCEEIWARGEPFRPAQDTDG